MISGLKLLNQADPAVQIIQQQTGEHVIICAGELHLERCILDLRENFAKIPIKLSPPIVPFRETLSKEPSMMYNRTVSKDTSLPLGTVRGDILNGLVQFGIRAIPMPHDMRSFLLKKEIISDPKAEKDAFLKELSNYFQNINTELPDVKLEDWRSR